MIDAADVIITYVTRDWGGATKIMGYAKRKKENR